MVQSMAIVALFLLVTSFSTLTMTQSTLAQDENKEVYCMPTLEKGVNDNVLQKYLDFACGAGQGLCDLIQQGGKCFEPNTVWNHAAFAMNSYYQHFNRCDFNGIGYLTPNSPNYGDCKFLLRKDIVATNKPNVPNVSPLSPSKSTPAAPTPIAPAPAKRGKRDVYCMPAVKKGVNDVVLQKCLDFACSAKEGLCDLIQQGRKCFEPNTLWDHAAFAMNSYYQHFNRCDFGSFGYLTTKNPSYGNCTFLLRKDITTPKKPNIPSLFPPTRAKPSSSISPVLDFLHTIFESIVKPTPAAPAQTKG